MADLAKEKFESFHRANPKVYTSLRHLAMQLLAVGHTTYAIAGLFEVVRWQRAIQTSDIDYKINNNYKPRYARLLMIEEPRLVGFFELRRMAGESDKEREDIENGTSIF